MSMGAACCVNNLDLVTDEIHPGTSSVIERHPGTSSVIEGPVPSSASDVLITIIARLLTPVNSVVPEC